MTGIMRRRLPFNEYESGDQNKPKTNVAISKRKKLKKFLKPKIPKIRWHNTWTLVLISSLIIITVFSLGVWMGSSYVLQPRDSCGLIIPKAKPPAVTTWNGKYTVGTLVWHNCSKTMAINYLYVCNWDFMWLLVLDLPCECPNDPIHLPKTSAVLQWNGENNYYNEANVKCNSNDQSLIALKLICTKDGIWKIINETSCDCPGFAFSRYIIENTNSSLSKYQIGSSVIEKCSWQENSPSFRSFFCNVNSEWTMLEEHNQCECFLDPPIDPGRHTKWSHSSSSNLIGTKVVSLCAKEPTSNVYEAYQCDADRKWKLLTSPEESYCDSEIRILQPNTYYLSTTLCKLYNGHLATPSNWEERYELAISLRQLHHVCTENWFYLGIVEDLQYQWLSRSKPTNYDDLDLVWDIDNPKNESNRCTVMTNAGKLQNVNCETYKSCILCEKESKVKINIFNEYQTIYEAHQNCSSKQMTLISITSKLDVINLFTRIQRERLICQDYFTDLKHVNRVWNYVTGNKVTTHHWSKGEPKTFVRSCVAISKSGNFMNWETISCRTLGCGVCQQYQT